MNQSWVPLSCEKALLLDCHLEQNVAEEAPKDSCVSRHLPPYLSSPGHIPIPAKPLCGK